MMLGTELSLDENKSIRSFLSDISLARSCKVWIIFTPSASCSICAVPSKTREGGDLSSEKISVAAASNTSSAYLKRSDGVFGQLLDGTPTYDHNDAQLLLQNSEILKAEYRASLTSLPGIIGIYITPDPHSATAFCRIVVFPHP